jgi:formylglycine-generating enzyme required for sulfatase activity
VVLRQLRDDKTQPVAKKKPNAFGLYDMHGNVMQWVEDTYQCFAAVPGTSLLDGSSARPSATGSLPAFGAVIWAFVSGGRLRPESETDGLGYSSSFYAITPRETQ